MLCLGCVQVHGGLGLLNRLHGACSGHASARTRHSLQKVAIVFPGLCHGQQFSAFIIGDHVTIRECASVHRAVGEGNETRIGNNVLMMAYTHVAHNCIVGNNVIMSNVATLAGHVIVEDRAVIGGLTAVHQFTKIGRNCMCGGMSRINQDVPPFVIVAGNPPVVAGLNSVGISRAGIAMPVRRELKKAYKILYKRGLSLPDAIATMEQELDSYEEVEHFMRFLRSVERGICRSSVSHGRE